MCEHVNRHTPNVFDALIHTPDTAPHSAHTAHMLTEKQKNRKTNAHAECARHGVIFNAKMLSYARPKLCVRVRAFTSITV